MLWILAYLMVGLLYTTIRLYPSIRKTALEKVDDVVWVIATIIISIVVIFLLTPFWYALFGFDVAKFFYKRGSEIDV
ncbi:hypothetical protein ABEO66_13785 [Bacillus pacificus]|uniref:hypothetical protein n=1 Tax=Bacillus pacificus TaxID=2026187 RepID=UPI003D1A161C